MSRTEPVHGILLMGDADLRELIQSVIAPELEAMEKRMLTALRPVPTTTSRRDSDRLLSPSQLAAKLCVDVKTIRRWVKRGILPAPLKFGGCLRFDPAAIKGMPNASRGGEGADAW